MSDKLLDLRECKLHGSDLSGKTLSGALLLDADLSGSNLREAVFSKAGPQALQHLLRLISFLCCMSAHTGLSYLQAYAVNTNFSGAAGLV